MADFLKAGFLLALALAAAPAHGQSAAEHVDAGDLRLEALPKQELVAGHCSLFLWSRSERPVFILFVTDNPARAMLRVEGKLRTVDRTKSSGERLYDQFPHQTFSGAALTFDVDLTFDQDTAIKDGAVIKAGVLRTHTKDGAEVVLPIGGMVGCKPA